MSQNTNICDKLEKQLSNKSKKLELYSPLSLYSALLLLYLGTRGKSHAELQEFLGIYGNDQDIMNRVKLINQNTKSTDKTIISNTNYILCRGDHRISDAYKKLFHYICGNDGLIENFNDPSEAIEKVNSYVNNHTRGLISKVINQSNVGNDTILLLVNVLYFKSLWSIPFSPDNTHEELFYGSSHSRYLNFMHNTDHYPYYEDNLGKYLKIPFIGDRYSMNFILPHDRLSTNLNLMDVNQSYYENDSDVVVSIPKFERTVDLNLTNILGLKEIFKFSTDFVGLFDKPELICVSEILQKLVVKVDENGAEAAAATTIMCNMDLCRSPDPHPLKTFKADHKFKYIIYDNVYKITLFSGILE